MLINGFNIATFFKLQYTVYSYNILKSYSIFDAYNFNRLELEQIFIIKEIVVGVNMLVGA